MAKERSGLNTGDNQQEFEQTGIKLETVKMELVKNDLIPIYRDKETDQELVDGRELHEKLGVDARFNDWIINQIRRARLSENEHYVLFTKNSVKPQGGRPTKEYALTLDACKHICMMQGDEVGFKFRDYFIRAEKELRRGLGVPQLSKKDLAKMLLESEEEKEELQHKIIEMKPIVDFVENNYIPLGKSVTLNEYVKIHEFRFPDGGKIHCNNISKLLRGEIQGYESLKFLMRNNVAYAKYCTNTGNGLFQLKPYWSGNFPPKTLITSKGQKELFKALAAHGINPKKQIA